MNCRDKTNSSRNLHVMIFRGTKNRSQNLDVMIYRDMVNRLQDVDVMIYRHFVNRSCIQVAMIYTLSSSGVRMSWFTVTESRCHDLRGKHFTEYRCHNLQRHEQVTKTVLPQWKGHIICMSWYAETWRTGHRIWMLWFTRRTVHGIQMSWFSETQTCHIIWCHDLQRHGEEVMLSGCQNIKRQGEQVTESRWQYSQRKGEQDTESGSWCHH